MDCGQKLFSCSGQDLTRRGAKSKNQRMMMVLPSQLAFKGTDVTGILGRIEKANTENPELVIEADGGEVRYIGKFVLTSSLYFTVKLQPRQQSSVCEDVFDRVLMFENPKTNQVNTTSLSQDLSSEYKTAFGCSVRSDPLTGDHGGGDEDDLEEEEEEEEVLPSRSLPSRAKKEAVKKYVDKGSNSETSDSDNDVMTIDDSSSEEVAPKKKSTPRPRPKANNPKPKTPSTSKASNSSKDSKSDVKKNVGSFSSARKRKVIDEDEEDDDDDDNDSEIEYIPRPTSRTSRGLAVKSYKEVDGSDADDADDDDDDDDDSIDSDFSDGEKKKKKKR